MYGSHGTHKWRAYHSYGCVSLISTGLSKPTNEKLVFVMRQSIVENQYLICVANEIRI